MAKMSQLDKVLAELRGQRDVLDLAIAKIEAQVVAQRGKPAKTQKPQPMTQETT